MVQNWMKISISVTEAEHTAFKTLCQRKRTNKNKLGRELIRKEILPILQPTKFVEQEGLPTFGTNRFKYNADKQNFMWQLDCGNKEVHCLMEDVSLIFLENLQEEIGRAIGEHKKIISTLKKGRTIIPKKLFNYSKR